MPMPSSTARTTSTTRTTRRKHVAAALSLARGPAALAALLGCGAPSGGGEAQPSGGPPVTIRWVNDVGEPLADAFNADFAKRFEAKYGSRITAQVEGHPDPDWAKRYEKYTAMAVGGTMPEVVWLCCNFIRPFMTAGMARELDPYIKRDWKQAELDDFFKGPLEGMRVEGRQLAIPMYLNTVIMYVNKDHLRQAGLPYPAEDWDKARFVEYAQKLTQRGERWGFDMNFAGVDRNVTWIWMHGAEPHDPKDGPVVTKLTYDSPKTVEALQFLHDLLWKQQVSPASDAQRAGLGTQDAFIAGKTSMYLEATGDAGTINLKGQANNLDWDFLPLVKGPGGYGSRISMDGYLVDKATKHGEQAWTVLKELVSPESQTARATLARRQPSRKSVAAAWEQAYAGKNAKLGRLMAEGGRPDARAFWKDAATVGATVTRHLQATLLRNEMGVAQAMRTAMEEVRGYYGGAR
jgi:multiple sugar transport system substrate-binding protein